MRSLLCTLAVTSLIGCAPSRGQVFRPVASAAAERTGYEVDWRSSMMSDARVRDAVAGLLADELTLDEAVRVALFGNRRLQAAFDELGIARGELATASVLRNPELEAEVRFSLGDGGTPDIELGAAQDLLDLITRGRRRAVASAELEAARVEAIGAVVDLVAVVRAAYYDALAAEQRHEMRTTIASAVEASYELARRLREAGNITELALLRERDFHEQAAIELVAARAARTASRERLTAVLGLRGEQAGYRLPTRLPELPADAIDLDLVARQAVARSLDLEGERWRMRAAAGRVGLTRLERWLPELAVGVTAEREGEDGSWGVGPSVGLAIPLWDQGGGQIARREAELSRAQHRHHALAVEVRAEARVAVERLRAARARAEGYRDRLLPLRAEVVEQTQLAYNAMAASAFELLEARRREIEAGAAYVDALLEYWRARAAVEQLLAGRRPMTDDVPNTADDAVPGASRGDH